MWMVAALCVLLALIKVLSPVMSVGLIVFVLAVIAHVIGNSLGTKLRDNGCLGSLDEDTRQVADLRASVDRGKFCPPPRLGVRAALGRSMIVVSIAGALVGAICGGALLAWANWQEATPPNMVVGTGAFAVLGGFAGFGSSTFVEVLWGAITQAVFNGE